MVVLGWAYALLNTFPQGANRGLYAGKGIMHGVRVTFSNKKTKRVWRPNVHKKTYYSEIFGTKLQLRMTAAAMRWIDKAGGFDSYIYHTPDHKLASELGVALKRRMRKRVKKIPTLSPPPLVKRYPHLPKSLQSSGTIKVAESRQEGGASVHRGSPEIAGQKTPHRQRWVPSTAREHLDPNELIFRRIRGILNKLTPDNFERLSHELTHHASVNSREILKGTILLVFDKALDEPNYSSMYSQLCLRLNDFAPNFEEPGSQQTTFRKLLLHKCQEEFENRKQDTAAFERRGEDGLSPEEEEQRTIAKRKMLGNIKFVGELFKLGMLHEAIIHSCIKELLEKKRNQSVEDTCKSIECLCHFMTTVGKKLDTEKAKGWMDKYFDRMQALSTNKELTSRIRFMLLDIIDLRKNKWLPRRSNVENAPRPIHEIRQEVYQERKPHSGPPRAINIPPFSQGGPYYNPPTRSDEGFLSSPPTTKDSLLSPETVATFPPPPLPIEAQQKHTEAAAVTTDKPAEKRPPRKLPSGKTNETVSLRPATASLKHGSSRPPSYKLSPSPTPDHMTSGGRGKVGERPSPIPRTRDDSSDEEGPPRRSTNKGPHPHTGPPPPTFHPPLGPPYAQRMFAPRGVDPFLSRPPPHIMPPPQGPGLMMYRPPLGHMMPPGPPIGSHRYFPPPLHPPGGYFGPLPHVQGGPMPSYPPYGPPRPPMPFVPLHWVPPGPDMPRPPHEVDRGPLPPPLERVEPPVVVKYASSSSKGGKRGGGPASRKMTAQDEKEKKMEPVLDQFLQSLDVESAAGAIERLEGIRKEVICSLLLTKTLEKSEDDRTHVTDLLHELYSREFITGAHFLQAFNSIMASISDYESDLPQCKTYIAGFVARAIAKGMVSVAEVAPTFNQGAYHPTVLVLLQALSAIVGEDATFQKFQESGVKLSTLLPVSHDAISELMESKNLGFLYPLKKIQTELTARLKQDNSAVAIYKWIKNSVDPSFYPTADFVMILTRCILDHVTRGSSLAPGVGRNESPSRDVVAKEKELVQKFKILVQKFVSDNIPLQIGALYATQVFCHDQLFPKGLLLRLFSYWYDMDVVDEEAFLIWKEDISQEFPGKGQALFQVNQWLVLLAEAEDEASSSEEDD